MKLSALFGDGMVLQRGQKNLLWGYTKAGVEVSGKFAGEDFATLSGTEGYFEVVLPKAAVGGPYDLWISDGETICIKDILIGDVFLLGGQSNMELPLRRTLDLFREELKEMEEPEIRMFDVPKEYLFGAVREDLESGKWTRAVGEAGMDFSAVGFFLAKALRQQKQIPIGLLQTAVGGTPVQAWSSEDSLYKLHNSTGEIEQCKDSIYVSDTIEKEGLQEQNWHREARQAIARATEWSGEVKVPGLWQEKPLADFHGSMFLEKKIDVTTAQSRCSAFLVLGAIVDADRVYVNGVMVGETGYKYPPRRYEIPAGLLRPGLNSIRIELFVFRESGGFIPEKPYEILFEDTEKSVIRLEGVWKYAIGKEMPELPNMTFFVKKAAGLYNGMIYPIRKWNICSILFYQGESNTDSPDGYSELLKAMIGDWRALWKRAELPFIYVQLAGFANANRDSRGTNWAVLREEQRVVLNVPNTAMVVAFDVGEFNDLHPQDKKTVGERLSLAVRRLVYEEEVVYCGPLIDKAVPEGEKVRLLFGQAKEDLQIGMKFANKKSDTVLKGFEVCGQDGIFVPAIAQIDGSCVIVWREGIKEIWQVRYAWLDNPEEANLYNAENLPASPFLMSL